MLKIPQKIRLAWINEENEKLADGKRKYLHFDLRIASLTKKIVKDIQTPNLVIRHSFYPFIRREKKWRKYKRVPGENKKIITEKIRPISYASHFDSLVYSWYSYVLSYFYERKIRNLKIDESIQAYRKIGNKCNIDFAKDIFNEIKKQEECAIICIDLEKFFDKIDHHILKYQWAKIIETTSLPVDHYYIFRNITNFTYINYANLKLSIRDILLGRFLRDRICSPNQFRRIISESELIIENKKVGVGIPQGSTISALLSNLYMLDFDKNIRKYADSIFGVYKRYCDDIILVCQLSELENLEKVLRMEVDKIKIKINDSKTEKKIFRNIDGIGYIFDYFSNKESKLQYLGFEFDGNKIFLRHSGISNFQRKMSRTIKKLAYRAKILKRAFPKKKILRNFYYSKKSNYLSYAKRSANSLDSNSIRNQILPKRIMKKIKSVRKKFDDK